MNLLPSKYEKEQEKIHEELLEIFADDFTMEDLMVWIQELEDTKSGDST